MKKERERERTRQREEDKREKKRTRNTGTTRTGEHGEKEKRVQMIETREITRTRELDNKGNNRENKYRGKEKYTDEREIQAGGRRKRC